MGGLPALKIRFCSWACNLTIHPTQRYKDRTLNSSSHTCFQIRQYWWHRITQHPHPERGPWILSWRNMANMISYKTATMSRLDPALLRIFLVHLPSQSLLGRVFSEGLASRVMWSHKWENAEQYSYGRIISSQLVKHLVSPTLCQMIPQRSIQR